MTIQLTGSRVTADAGRIGDYLRACLAVDDGPALPRVLAATVVEETPTGSIVLASFDSPGDSAETFEITVNRIF
ncbi:hypothetical protein [Streptomyces sp. TR02-1]|uniref:hypothetical protein n=1 Tax=Streptomyces sp. TR02-1 TaxID=3385977 RepID=UPI0039A259BD